MTAVLFGSISSLADTSELQRDAFNRAFAEHGLDWTWEQGEYAALLTGNGGADRIAQYAADRGVDVDADAVHATKSTIFQESLRSAAVEPRPGVVDTIARAREAGYAVALVTTTSRENVDALTAALAGAVPAESFDLVVDAGQVSDPKPDPAAYRYALERLGQEPSSCVAVEDNVGGVRAAGESGVAVVAFPNVNTAGHDFSAADDVVERLDLDRLAGFVAASA